MQTFWTDLPRPFFVLAPMEAVTDTVFRHVVARAARPDVFFTEFTNAASFVSPKGQHSTRGRLLFTADEQPMVAQIWGTNPEHFAQMSHGLKEMGFAGIDINMGCPAKDVVKTGACAALIEQPTLAAELIAAAKASGLPVSVKTRLGFREEKTEEWLGHLLRQDIAALTIHARTASDMSKVPARWQEVARGVQLRDQLAPHTLIIGNGDVIDRAHGLRLAAQTGADGIMIGRGALQNPWCFAREAREHSLSEHIALLRFQLDLFEKTWAGTPRPFDPLKRFFKIYVRNFPEASSLRERLMATHSIDEVHSLIDAAFPL